ncbi:MAG TPA: purine-binding chemotaxis protein CheW [Clostridiales bacterium]|nr:purine-binding chemotaxis protein CheW [Clostridiales bacterium]
MEMDLFMGGASEVEILEFRVGKNPYGININDIKEILPYDKEPTPVPNSHAYIEGIIIPREVVLPIVNLAACFGLESANDDGNDMNIIANINNLHVAFHVDSVSGIHKVAKAEIKELNKRLSINQKNVIIGVFETEDRMIEIVDLRKIIANLNSDVNVG